MSLREWLIIIGAFVILAVVIDGLRRMYRARQDSLEIARGMGSGEIGHTPVDDGYNAELPNGGARVSGDDNGVAEGVSGPDDTAWAETDSPATVAEDRGFPAQAGNIPSGPDREPQDPAHNEIRADALAATQDDWVVESISTSDDDGILGPARVRRPESEQGSAAGDGGSNRREAMGMNAGHLWQKFREGAARVGEAAGHAQGTPDDAPASPASSADPEASSGERPSAGSNRPDAGEVIVINVHCRGEDRYQGESIRALLEACGMEFGDLGIYHRHETSDTRTPLQFSVASAVTPGTLHPDELETLRTPGLSFFLSLPGPSDPVQAFDYMLETAQALARNLGGELRDENHSVMTTQTIEHCRQRIREFERKRRSVKA